MSEEAFIYEAIRTPRGKQRNGALTEVKPLNLVVGLIEELRSRFPDLDESMISDVILGCVSPVGDQGADIARTAVIAAGMPDTVGGVQLNRFCASGLEAVNTAAQKVRSGWDDMVLAGGVESMSRVPMGSDGGAMFTDIPFTYDNYIAPQGIGADLIATIEGFSRDDVDAYALQSQQRAADAWSGGYFAKSVVPVRDQNGLLILDHDEHMRPGYHRGRSAASSSRPSSSLPRWPASTTWRCRSTTGSRRSTTSTPAATAPASSTAPRWCSSAARRPARRRA